MVAYFVCSRDDRPCMVAAQAVDEGAPEVAQADGADCEREDFGSLREVVKLTVNR